MGEISYRSGGDRMNNLKMIRLSRDMTQRDLSEKSGVSIHMIQFYEQGVRDINRAEALTVYKLSQVLGCRMEDLLNL